MLFGQSSKEGSHPARGESTPEGAVAIADRGVFVRISDRQNHRPGGGQSFGAGAKVASIIVAAGDDHRSARRGQNRGVRGSFNIRINDHTNRRATSADIPGVKPGIICEDRSDSRQDGIDASAFPMNHAK
jgi:hypothetical protein